MPDLTSVTQTFNAARDSAAAYTSGVSALPGGLGAMSNVVDNAKGALNSIPGLGAVTGALGKLPVAGALGGMAAVAGSLTGALGSATGALGSLPDVGAVTGALGALGGITSLATKGLNALKSGALSLSGLPSSLGLPPGEMATLNTAMASLTSDAMKPPTAATGTFNRGGIESMAALLLGSSKIPKFAAAGNPATLGASMSAESVKKYDENRAEIAKTSDDFFEQRKLSWDAQSTYEKAKNELPQGDPKIDQLRSVFVTETRKTEALEKKLTALRSA